MATIRDGNQPVLAIVDVQVGVMGECWEASRVIDNVSRAVERARSTGVPVVWIQHSDAQLQKGSAAWQLVPELQPRDSEPVIHKTFESAFEQTDLEPQLARLGATHVVLAGAATNWCVRATAYAALDRGYDLTLLKDAHTTKTLALEDGTVLAAAGVVADLNVTMKWIAYPGRRNGTVATDRVDFTRAGGAD